jgi:hypothetical protein
VWLVAGADRGWLTAEPAWQPRVRLWRLQSAEPGRLERLAMLSPIEFENRQPPPSHEEIQPPDSTQPGADQSLQQTQDGSATSFV